MTTKMISDHVLEKKMPNVFERLSKQHSNKVNSQRNLKSFNQDPKRSPKSVPSSVRRKNVSSTKNLPIHQKNRNHSTGSKKESFSSYTYHEKALMEKVPETVGKDLEESFGKDAENQEEDNLDSSIKLQMENSSSSEDDLNKKSYQVSSLSSSQPSECTMKSDDITAVNVKNRDIPLSKSQPEVNGLTKAAPKINNPAKSTSLPIEKVNSDDCVSEKSPIKKSPATNNITEKDVVQKTPKFESENVKLKLKNLLSSTKLETIDKTCKESNNKRTNLKVTKSNQVLDDDKDICEDDKESEDGDFYNVKVQTRLVSYENSMLVIRNTSKQTDTPSPTSDSQTVGESSSLHESLSSSSLQSSLSGQESFVSEDSVAEPSEEGAQTRLKGVRNKLGQLMTKGKSILNDVRNSGYVPDVKTSFSKFQDVTRRSLRSMQALPKGSSPALPHGENNVDKLHKSELDSGFSSLNSTVEQHVISDDGKSRLESPPPVAVRHQQVEPGTSDSLPNDLQVDDSKRSTNEEVSRNGDPSEEAENSSDFTKFFSSCSCQNARVPPLPNDDEQVLKEGMCCYQQDSEFPLEIRELLDADHARMWWTITGNFGNILPIDWSKTYTRQKYLPVLNLNEAKKCSEGNIDSVTPSPREDEDEEVAQDLDLHQLILAGTQQDNEPVKSAEEVIKEIDDIMQEVSSSEDEGIDASSSDSKGSSKTELQQLPLPLYHDKLKDLNVNELNETLMELEVVIRRYSETLIAQLAHRDELEYEKELKNTFISLLLQVQNKRRNYNVEKKKIKKPLGPNGVDPKYLTTVIPYDVGHGPPDNETIQILIKILIAINEDSPTVPTLLTDYILKVLCPS